MYIDRGGEIPDGANEQYLNLDIGQRRLRATVAEVTIGETTKLVVKDLMRRRDGSYAKLDKEVGDAIVAKWKAITKEK